MSNTTRYPQCHMRTALGNCDPIGGFCTSVNESVCEALHKVSRPQGKWIDAEILLESGGSMPIQACNLCKTFYPLAYTGGGHRFCPNCGADMRADRKE